MYNTKCLICQGQSKQMTSAVQEFQLAINKNIQTSVKNKINGISNFKMKDLNKWKPRQSCNQGKFFERGITTLKIVQDHKTKVPLYTNRTCLNFYTQKLKNTFMMK